MLFCRDCGHQVSSDWKYCRSCGTSLVFSQPESGDNDTNPVNIPPADKDTTRYVNRINPKISSKWLITLSIITVVLILGSILASNYANSQLLISQENGLTEGNTQGNIDGYKEGASVGYKAGYDEGYIGGDTDGYEAGEVTGYKEGKAVGKADGISIGYPIGEQEGYTSGHIDGFKTGSTQGQDQGYLAGFEEAIGADSLVHNTKYEQIVDMLNQSSSTTVAEINSEFEAQRIRSGLVWVKFQNGQGLGRDFIAFQTIDKGTVIFDPKSHKELHLVVGDRMSELLGYSSPSYDDTISSITITW